MLDREISTLEARLSTLRAARAALGGGAGRRGRQTGAMTLPEPKRIGRRPGFKVSAATRAKLRAAWKRRKAAQTKA
jgi:hypothetical protein